MKKLGISVGVLALFLLYSIHEHSESGIVKVTAPVTTGNSNTESSGSSSSTSTTTGTYKDGVYTGSAADAFYGNIQVKVTISSGRISDITFLQYPNDRRDSIEINTAAMPLLKQEAIQVQSAQVNVVSGATDSSHAFNESLASALTQAK